MTAVNKHNESSSFMTADNRRPQKDSPSDTDTKKPENKKRDVVPTIQLFQYANGKDIAMIIVGSVFNVAAGALLPASALILGNVLDSSSAAGLSATAGSTIDASAVYPKILRFVYFGVAMIITGYVSQCLWTIAGENQGRRIRQMYLSSVLRQDMEWFDKAEDGSLTTRLAQDCNLIQEGISEKFGLCVQSVVQFISGIVIAFVQSPLLALVTFAILPVILVFGGIGMKKVSALAKGSQDAYAAAGSVAEQAIAGIRTVCSFSLQLNFSEKYDANLANAESSDRNRGVTFGFVFGSTFLLILSAQGLSFWYGSHLVWFGQVSGGSVLVAYMAFTVGVLSLLQLPQNISAVTTARGAAFKIYDTINRVPSIDSRSNDGLTPVNTDGKIVLEQVSFAYPTRPDSQIFENLSLTIESGQTVAFVGPSGSGKSSIIQLIQRFYDPLSGKLTLDGTDIKSLNVKWLRQNIGVVSQEPCLFNSSIKQNILLGAPGDSVTETELIEVCKAANCHDFIMQLPQGYDTHVGEHGGMLSGGQKQRIAIARALMKNPKILILDEATSALDTQSERIVQAALDRASASRTTIMIAHRLSTVKNADKIIVLDKGRILEMGKHSELIALDGLYNKLVERQKIKSEVEGVLKSNTDVVEENDFSREEFLSKGVVQKDKIAVETRLTLEDETTMRAEAAKAIKKSYSESKVTLQEKSPILRVLRLMKPEWGSLVVGVIGAGFVGAIFPLMGFLQSSVVVLLLDPTQQWPAPFQGSNMYAFAFVLLAFLSFSGMVLQNVGFERAGAALTRRMRLMTFKSMLRQEVAFFDEKTHTLGALTSRLAVDASRVGDLVTKVWGDVAQIIVTLICGLTIGFYFSWRLTLVLLLVSPFMVVASYYQIRMRRGFEDSSKTAYIASGTIAAEAFKEIRTVAQLCREGYFETKYAASLQFPHEQSIKNAKYASIGNGVLQGLSQFVNALGFYVGLRFIEAGLLEFSSLFKVLLAVMLTAQSLGRSTTFVETYSKAKLAAINTFQLVDRQSAIDPESANEGQDNAENITGDFSFSNVAFTYPSRPNQPVFNGNLNLSAAENMTIALVGPSGCGKSSAIGLLLRWYDVNRGVVKAGNMDVRNYQISKLRAQMALVGQEPVLFDMSIRDNIIAGSNGKSVSDFELHRAAQIANIAEFVNEFPEKFETRVGDKGSQLSGGQKQRIAIARALIRNPKFLLFDEATSALDSESEMLVQSAIDSAVSEHGRTVITIAHRLSSIQNSDLIAVVKDGAVIELGKHEDLLEIPGGVYAALVKEQDLNVLM
ncbi:Multidrug resistance protein 1 [Entophlyctis sp. JEL0112]|nr:Multidrug resistance protein 1 [Entophlyctis sp. JEL0112]